MFLPLPKDGRDKSADELAAVLAFFVDVRLWHEKKRGASEGLHRRFSPSYGYMAKIHEKIKPVNQIRCNLMMGWVSVGEPAKPVVTGVYRAIEKRGQGLRTKFLKESEIIIVLDGNELVPGKGKEGKNDKQRIAHLSSILNWLTTGRWASIKDDETTDIVPVLDDILIRYSDKIVDEWDYARKAESRDKDRLDRYVSPHCGFTDYPLNLTETGFVSHVQSTERIKERIDERRADGYKRIEVDKPDEDAAIFELLKQAESKRWLCVTEDAGVGKSVFSRVVQRIFCSAEGQKVLSNGKPVLAVRWESGWPGSVECEGGKGLCLEDALAARLADELAGSIDDMCPHARQAIAERRVVLILDALDQAPADAVKYLGSILKLKQHRQNLRIVLTSRFHAISHYSKTLFKNYRDDLNFAHIEGFDRVQQDRYFERLTDEHQAYRRELVPDPDSLQDLLQVPEVLRLILEIVERADVSTPATPIHRRGDLYWKVADRMLERSLDQRELRLPEGMTKHDKELVLQLVCTTAYEMLRHKCLGCVVPDANLTAAKLQERVMGRSSDLIQTKWSALWQFLENSDLTDRCVMFANTNHTIGFRSLKTMEFYAGLYLAKFCDAAGFEEAAGTLSLDKDNKHWEWAWRFALEMCDAARDPETLTKHVERIFERPSEGLRPTELMYRAWPLLGEPCQHDLPEFGWTLDETRSKLPKGSEILAAFRADSAEVVQQLELVTCPKPGWSHQQGDDPCVFWMGAPDKIGEDDEHPRHRVRVRPFEMMTTTVTKEQYWQFDPANRGVYDGMYQRVAKDETCPAIGVNWFDANLFARWLGDYRLPTEAEWEFACRAGKDGILDHFHFGEQLSPDDANFNPTRGNTQYAQETKEYRQKTLPVKSLAKNEFGLYQMHGNVWEWCQDYFDEDTYRRRLRQAAVADGHDEADVQGSTDAVWVEIQSVGSSRLLRGGSWYSGSDVCRSAYRSHRSDPSYRRNVIGFRLCRGVAGSLSRDL
ncbi:MAG: formylglycine-generating enzyme family protein [Planctomycetaceae bacterium]